MKQLSRSDREALERAIEMACQESRDRAAQIDAMLHQQMRPWLQVAKFAASCCQRRALRVKPWQMLPLDVIEIEGDDPPAVLLRRMLAAGLSKYEPDPLKALAEAKSRPTAA